MEKREKEKKLSKKDFIIVILMIFFLSGFSFWHFKNFKKSISEFKPPKVEIPKPKIFPKREGYKEWISPDGKLKLKYPAEWTEVDKRLLEQFPVEKINGSKILFLAQKFNFEKVSQAFLLVEELNLKDKSFDEIIETMKKNIAEKETEMIVLNKEEKEKEALLEVLYKRKNGFALHSKEKLIRGEGKLFLISFFTFNTYWTDFKKEREEILSNVKYLE